MRFEDYESKMNFIERCDYVLDLVQHHDKNARLLHLDFITLREMVRATEEKESYCGTFIHAVDEFLENSHEELVEHLICIRIIGRASDYEVEDNEDENDRDNWYLEYIEAKKEIKRLKAHVTKLEAKLRGVGIST